MSEPGVVRRVGGMTRQADPVAAEWVVFRDLTAAGRSVEAIALADRIAAESDDPARVAQALIEKLVSLINLGRIEGVGPLLDEIVTRLRQAPSPRLVGEFHVMAAVVGYEHGSLSVAVTHLVRAERSLRVMTEINLAASDAWHDLSVTHSVLGFHREAVEAMRRARMIAGAAGLPPSISACMETLVRSAVTQDQRGFTDSCVRELQAVVHIGREMVADLVPMERVFLRYATHRLAVLQKPTDLDVPLDDVGDTGLAEVNRLTEVCQSLAGGNPVKAVELLDAGPWIGVFGAAEPLRLRSIALAATGDHASAREAERAVLRAVTVEELQLRDRFTESVGARLDQERLRRVAARHADAASTDPLTGLPNRRRIDAFMAALRREQAGAVVGVLDLNGFKAVNDTHGHHSGDLVLQRIAGILARAVRTRDLLARYGGDEFVLILPVTTVDEAYAIGRRITRAIGDENWQALVPGTPVSASIGWAEHAPDARLADTLQNADRALYEIKRSQAAER